MTIERIREHWARIGWPSIIILVIGFCAAFWFWSQLNDTFITRAAHSEFEVQIGESRKDIDDLVDTQERGRRVLVSSIAMNREHLRAYQHRLYDIRDKIAGRSDVDSVTRSRIDRQIETITNILFEAKGMADEL